MIRTINDDLFYTECRYIAHQVNCQGVMGSGVAFQVKQKFPNAYKEYLYLIDKHKKEPRKLLGVSQICSLENNKNIINMYAQYNYGANGRFTDYEAFYKCIEMINHALTSKDSIAMPYMIGCGRGGADWGIIKFMLEKVFANRDVYLYRHSI